MARFLPLDRFSPRALNLIATILSGHDTRVVLSTRLDGALTVVLESRTVLLHPDCTGLYDLVLGAQLLARRAAGRQGKGQPRRPYSATQIARWVAEAQASLARAYPGIGQLPGRFHPGHDLTGLDIVWNQVKFTPLEIPEGTGDQAGDDVPGLETIGTEDDFLVLLDALRKGRISLEPVEGLEGLPVFTFPITLSLPHVHGPRIEQLEEHIAEDATLIRQLMDCHRRKSETLDELAPLGRHMSSGIRLDSSRLVEAVLARRTGVEPRLFRRRRAAFDPVFDPARQLAVIAIDLNTLRRGWFRDPRPTHRFLALILTAFHRLEVDCLVLGFSDHLLELADASRVYAHVPIVLKAVDEDFDATFWNRLAHVIDRPPGLPQGSPACFHPLAMRTIRRWLDRIAPEMNHAYRSLLLWLRDGMPDDWLSGLTDANAYWTRTAQLMEDGIDEIRRRFEGTLDTQGCYVPREMKEHAPKNGAVAKMF